VLVLCVYLLYTAVCLKAVSCYKLRKILCCTHDAVLAHSAKNARQRTTVVLHYALEFLLYTRRRATSYGKSFAVHTTDYFVLALTNKQAYSLYMLNSVVQQLAKETCNARTTPCYTVRRQRCC
jgi:hypothetical protein